MSAPLGWKPTHKQTDVYFEKPGGICVRKHWYVVGAKAFLKSELAKYRHENTPDESITGLRI